MYWPLWLSLAVGVAASAEDLWRRRVSNVLTGSALLCGLGLNAFLAGWNGLLEAGLGAAIGFAVFFVFFLLGGMGGGDVKLMAAFGSIVGSGQIVTAAVMTALVGGAMALGYLVWRKVRRGVRRESADAARPDRKEFIPYAPAIALGVLLSFLSEEQLWTNV